MSKEISRVTVDKISLISDEEVPAVPKAEVKYAFFKKLFAPNKIKKKHIDELEKIEKKYTSIDIVKKLDGIKKAYEQ